MSKRGYNAEWLLFFLDINYQFLWSEPKKPTLGLYLSVKYYHHFSLYKDSFGIK